MLLPDALCNYSLSTHDVFLEDWLDDAEDGVGDCRDRVDLGVTGRTGTFWKKGVINYMPLLSEGIKKWYREQYRKMPFEKQTNQLPPLYCLVFKV